MPSFFGFSATPADNGSNATTTITITPPASMTVGDLVVVYLSQRGTATFSVGVSGGQTWSNIGRDAGTTNVASDVYWATYNGTWSANPRFDFSAGTNTNAYMIVFRPDLNTNVWALESSSTQNQAAAATITITGLTPTNNKNVNIASWTSADDNTWGTLTGTNWTQGSLLGQYRNLAGSDMSSTFAWQIQATAGATTNTSKTQLTLGNDATQTRRLTFYETEPVLGGFDPFGQMGIFGI